MKKYLNISFLLVLFCIASCSTEQKVYESGTASPKPKSLGFSRYNHLLKTGSPEAKYAAAVEYFNDKKYSHALPLFEELMSIYRGTDKAEEVTYYYAYSNYNSGDYIIGGYQFRNFVKNFPHSKYTELCAYMNAYCYYLSSPTYSLDQSDTYLAIKEFQHFTDQYPNGEHVAESNALLDKLRAKLERKSFESANLYYNMSIYKSAIVAFENHLKDFPGSIHEDQVHFLIIKSYYVWALNSVELKKEERFKAIVDSYRKYGEAFRKSQYNKDAEMIYSIALQNLEKYNKPI